MTTPDDRNREPLPEPIFEQSATEEVIDELQFHIDMRVRELLARGIERAVAERMARERFADLDRISAECRQLAQQREHSVKRTRYLTNLIQDIHFALRMLRRRPAFALLAITTIGLGIGAATAIYSVVDGVMLRPLPFNDPGKLVAIWVTEEKFRTDATLNSWWDHIVMGQEEFIAIREQAKSISDVALWGRSGVTLTTADGPVELSSIEATSNLLNTLRVQPELGRGFLPGDDVLDGPRVAMLSWEEWNGRWHGDTTMIGRSIQLGASAWTVIGILPRGLRLDRTAPPAAIWTPALRDSSDIPAQHNRNYAALARLRPGYATQQANAEVSKILQQAAMVERGKENGQGVGGRVERWQVDQTRTVRASLWILFGAVVLLLLIACVNVATLMLGEAARRAPEIGARAALGAGPGRIARQLVTESLAIATLGAIVGAAIGAGGLRLLVAMAPAKIPGIGDVRLDMRVLSFAILCAATTGILFGLAPALVLLRKSQAGTLRSGTGQTARGDRSLQHLLVAVEIALSLILLTGCALLGRSLKRLTDTAPGFDARNLAVVQFLEQPEFWRDNARVARYAPIAVRELSAIPGVTSVSASSSVPFNQGGSSSPVKSDGREYGPEDHGANAQQRTILPNYFQAMRIQMLAGRQFNASDANGSEPVIIVSEAEARRDWPGISPIGRRLHWQGGWRTVVGVVGDVKYAQLSRPGEPTVYIPFDQKPNSMMYVIRANATGSSLERQVQEHLATIDPGVSVSSVVPIERLIGKSYGEERYRALLASLFGLLAGALAAIGLFGVVSRAVARRTRESGIRRALGASASALTRLMMRETLTGVAIGIAVGVPAALEVGSLLKPYLFGISAADPIAIGLAVGSLTLAGLGATLQAARRAGRVDPATVLRAD